MKKTFQLNVKNKKRDRVVEAIKNEVRKYIKRERNKKLPKDTDFWQFECKYAKNGDLVKTIRFNDIIPSIDDAALSDVDSFYLEIIAVGVKKENKPLDAKE